ncbi:MAG: Trm112 family protein [Promethearchaeota archaeon]
MKLWLNHILACPDDKKFPLKLDIFKWDTPKDDFDKLLKSYQTKTLINFKDPKNPLEIQKYKNKNNIEIKIEQETVHNENKRLINKGISFNVIKIIMKNGKGLIYDYNKVNPVSIEEYFKYYIDVLDEFKGVNDKSENKTAKMIYNLTKNSVKETLNNFYDKFGSNDIKNRPFKEKTEIYNFLKPVFQELLFLNYYFFLMEIEEGILICPTCKHWFSIINTIPRLFPKHMERDELDINFKQTWSNKFPDDVV